MLLQLHQDEEITNQKKLIENIHEMKVRVLTQILFRKRPDFLHSWSEFQGSISELNFT